TSWQRIGGESPPRGRPGQSDARGTVREDSREAFTGETMGWVLSCETGLISRRRSRSAEEKATPPTRNGLRGRASRSRRSQARGDVLCTEPGRPHPYPAGQPDRFMKAKAER